MGNKGSVRKQGLLQTLPNANSQLYYSILCYYMYLWYFCMCQMTVISCLIEGFGEQISKSTCTSSSKYMNHFKIHMIRTIMENTGNKQKVKNNNSKSPLPCYYLQCLPNWYFNEMYTSR